jgi:hypothetical protein
MAHNHHANLIATAGLPVLIPFPNDAAGVVLADILTDMRVNTNGQPFNDPVVDVGMSLIEVDSVNQPGMYYLRLTPPQAGILFIDFTHGGHTFDYTISVQDQPLPDASLEGEYVVTVDDGVAPVQGALVRVFDAAGTRFITRGTTDALGQVTFTLPVGNYQVRAFRDGYDFSSINPTTITVTASESAAPVLVEVLPTTASIGDTIALVGRLFTQDSQVVFGAEATVAADYVNAAGTVLLVTVPTLVGTVFPLRVDKPDPANLPLGKLLSNSVTWVRA